MSQIEAEKEVVEIALTDIEAGDEYNCRVQISQSSVFSLAANIEQWGLQSPVSVRIPDPREGIEKKYVLVSGFRRYRAHVALGLKAIKAIVSDVTKEQAMFLNFNENVMREQLSYYEEAMAIKKMGLANFSREYIASKISQSPGYVQRRVRLLQMPVEVQELVRDGVLNISDIEQLSKYRVKSEFEAIVKKIQKDHSIGIKIKIPKASKTKVDRATIYKARNKEDILNAKKWIESHGYQNELLKTFISWCIGTTHDIGLMAALRNEVPTVEINMDGIPYMDQVGGSWLTGEDQVED